MVKIIKAIEKQSDMATELLFAKELEIESAAWESEFYKKSPKKITATALMYSFWQIQRLGKNTLGDWATKLGEHLNITVTEQSVNERFTQRAVDMAKLTLHKALNLNINKAKLAQDKTSLENIIKLFNRILLRDSTNQKLPAHLHEDFPGSYSHGDPTALMRIQALFDFTNEQWLDFQIGSNKDNDQGAADCIADFLQPNDLILQDLGYFTLDWLEQVIENQFIITKWKPNCHLLDLKENKIDLLALLKGKKQVDMQVLVGSKKRIPMRLVARKLPRAKADKRIKEAKKDRHSKANHSKEYFELLRYEIYLTNISEDMLCAKEIAKLYGLRWYIEILFKSWKSYANFKKMFDKKKMHFFRTLFTVYILLIEFVWFTTVIYKEVKNKIKKMTTFHLSILKFMSTINNMLTGILNITEIRQLEPYIKQFAQHATHKPHTKRDNMINKYLYVKELCVSFF